MTLPMMTTEVMGGATGGMRTGTMKKARKKKTGSKRKKKKRTMRRRKLTQVPASHLKGVVLGEALHGVETKTTNPRTPIRPIAPVTLRLSLRVARGRAVSGKQSPAPHDTNLSIP